MWCFQIFRQTFQSGETYNEQGQLKRVTNPEDGEEKEVIVTRGSYTIIDKDGSTVLVNYTADETGKWLSKWLFHSFYRLYHFLY